MPEGHQAGLWLLGTAAALGLLAITGSLGLRLRLSTAPGYLLGGLLLGTVFDIHQTFLHVLTVLGSMLILFFVGLEFSPRSLGKRLRELAVPAAWDAAINMAVAWLAAVALGLTPVAATIFALAAYASSSAIIAKSLIDHRLLVLPEAELCLGILVVEDLLMALLLPLCVFFLGAGSWQALGGMGISFMAGIGLVVILIVLASRGFVSRWLDQPEKGLTLLASLALLCLVAGIGESSGMSAAIGALLTGMVVAESGSQQRVEELLVPHRELLAVGFFAAIGASADWRLLIESLPVAAGLVAATSLAKVVSGYLGGRSKRLSGQASFRNGLMLVPRGEFTLVVAALTLDQPWGGALYNTAVAYVILSAIVGTVLIRYHAGLSQKLAALLPQ